MPTLQAHIDDLNITALLCPPQCLCKERQRLEVLYKSRIREEYI